MQPFNHIELDILDILEDTKGINRFFSLNVAIFRRVVLVIGVINVSINFANAQFGVIFTFSISIYTNFTKYLYLAVNSGIKALHAPSSAVSQN